MPVSKDEYFYAKDRAASGELTETQQERAEDMIREYEELNGEIDPRLNREDLAEQADTASRNLAASVLGLPGDVWALVTGEENPITSEALAEQFGGDVAAESFLLSQVIAPGPGELKAAATIIPILGVRLKRAQQGLKAARDGVQAVRNKINQVGPTPALEEELTGARQVHEQARSDFQKVNAQAYAADAAEKTAIAQGVQTALREPVTPAGRAMDASPVAGPAPATNYQLSREAGTYSPGPARQVSPDGYVPQERLPDSTVNFEGRSPEGVPHYGKGSMPDAPKTAGDVNATAATRLDVPNTLGGVTPMYYTRILVGQRPLLATPTGMTPEINGASIQDLMDTPTRSMLQEANIAEYNAPIVRQKGPSASR
ncbi:MAG: hypothetical protein ACYTBJ_21375 [Planctomycetota bacterium]|jgi:hypothetical protein